MAAPAGHLGPAALPAHDIVEFSAPPAQQHQLEKQQSSSSSRPVSGAGMDDKVTPLPVEPYAVDPEKQSSRVGSLHASSGPEPVRGPLAALWHRHWKKAAQLLAFMVFTASVTPLHLCLPTPPPPRTRPFHVRVLCCLCESGLMDLTAADGGFTASSSTATPTAWAG